MGTLGYDYDKGTTLFGWNGVLLYFCGVLLFSYLGGICYQAEGWTGFLLEGTPLAHLLGNKTRAFL